MLRITQQTSPDAVISYYSAADYYTEGRETVGVWGGKGAERLGLSGTMALRDFELLCHNRSPIDGRRLTSRTKEGRTVGYDFTFSVPKSVSLLVALGEDTRLVDAFRESARDTMRELEAEMKVRVRGENRNEEQTTGNLVWSEFVHFTSRPVDSLPDPQLHAHYFVQNCSYNEFEQAWRAGQFRDLKRDAPYWQAAFRVRLANQLQDLGYVLERKKDDFEIKGLAPELVQRFSRRTEQIEELSRELGIDDAKGKLGATSRERKNKELTWEELQQAWRERTTPAEQETLMSLAAAARGPVPRQSEEGHALDFALAHCFVRQAVVAEKRLLAEALKHGLGAVSAEDLRREYAGRELLVRERDGRRWVTTPHVLAEEERMIAFARQSRGAFRPLAARGYRIARDWLNAGQKRAVEHILRSRDGVMLVRGVAGTGKTTLMQEAVAGIRAGGHEVVVLAPSATASRDVLAEAGFDAETVAMFLRNPELQKRAAGQVIWVDEAGLLGSQDMAALFERAEQLRARVVLMGDRQQHGSVARGAPLKLLEVESGLPVAAVTDIMRQSGAYRKAVTLLSEGRTAEGFAALDQLGWIQEVPEQERYQHLAKAYVQTVLERKDTGEYKTAVVVSPTHAEGARVTAAIRSELAQQGKLKDERDVAAWIPAHLTEAERGLVGNYQPGDLLQFHQHARGYQSGQRVVVTEQALPLDQAARFQVFRPTTLHLAVGDRVRVTNNGWTRDRKHRLNNGMLLTVKKFTPEGHLVVDKGWVIDRDFGHLSHGYCLTSPAVQGKTVDKVFIGQSSLSHPASGQEQLYVSVSRGREQALLFTDDKEALQQAVQRSDERLTATDLVRPLPVPPTPGWWRHLAFLRRQANVSPRYDERATERGRDEPAKRELIHER